jgi:general secretion pathway protein C
MDSGASRFKITGVVAGKNDQGYALIAVDGKPARPFKVGSQVNDTLLLQSVNKSGAALAASLDGPIAFRLDLPKFEPL